MFHGLLFGRCVHKSACVKFCHVSSEEVDSPQQVRKEVRKKSATSVPGGGEEGFGDWEGEARDAAAAHGDAFRTLPGEVVL